MKRDDFDLLFQEGMDGLKHLIIILAFASSTGLTRTIETPIYTVRVPDSWSATKGAANSALILCNRRNGKCFGTGGGFPLSGAVTVVILPATEAPDHDQLRTPKDIISSVHPAGYPAPAISVVPLVRDDAKCLLARFQIAPGIWNETYGLEVDGVLFRAVVQYNDEHEKIEGYRKSVIAILSSLTLRK